jgi:hypothetical protein
MVQKYVAALALGFGLLAMFAAVAVANFVCPAVKS